MSSDSFESVRDLLDRADAVQGRVKVLAGDIDRLIRFVGRYAPDEPLTLASGRTYARGHQPGFYDNPVLWRVRGKGGWWARTNMSYERLGKGSSLGPDAIDALVEDLDELIIKSLPAFLADEERLDRVAPAVAAAGQLISAAQTALHRDTVGAEIDLEAANLPASNTALGRAQRVPINVASGVFRPGARAKSPMPAEAASPTEPAARTGAAGGPASLSRMGPS